MSSSFMAMMSRMKYISRWSLMRNTRQESLSEHTLETAMIAHLLCEIRNKRLGGNVDTGKIVLLALYHDAGEIITGDMPTPVKYHSEEMRQAYKQVEVMAAKALSEKLPDDLKSVYEPLLYEKGTAEETRIVKAADKLSALIKCIEERTAGNSEFRVAEESTLASIESMDMDEVKIFINEFLPDYYLTLDEQG